VSRRGPWRSHNFFLSRNALLEPPHANGVAATKSEATVVQFNHRAPQKMHSPCHSTLLVAAMAFLALIVVGAREQRAEPHVDAHVTGHDVIMPMIGMPAG
jgi:hypothetical protein